MLVIVFFLELTPFFSMAISGAFKFRGACNTIFSLDDAQAAQGIVTHSRFAPTANGISLKFGSFGFSWLGISTV